MQRAPDLLREIKASVDRDRRPGRFVLTGSADVLTLPGVSETLAGRMEVLRLWPLSQGEIEGRRECFLDALLAGSRQALADVDPARRDDLSARVAAGGFPEAVARGGRAAQPLVRQLPRHDAAARGDATSPTSPAWPTCRG